MTPKGRFMSYFGHGAVWNICIKKLVLKNINKTRSCR